MLEFLFFMMYMFIKKYVLILVFYDVNDYKKKCFNSCFLVIVVMMYMFIKKYVLILVFYDVNDYKKNMF